jgi:hypothetical protein
MLETGCAGFQIRLPSPSCGQAIAFLLAALFFQKPGVRPSAPASP